MKVPLSWLKKHIPLTETPEKIAERLTLAGLEVDGIDRYQFSFKDVIIGKVVETTPHPKSDKLLIAYVTDGDKKHQIVCSDQTLTKDMVVALALSGAEVEGVTVKKVKIQDIESSGMLCSEKELGLSQNAETVMHFAQDAPLGKDLRSYLFDPTFDIALTPNLGHARSIIGVARELGAMYEEKVEMPQFTLKEDPDNFTKDKIRLTNNDPENCLQYMCRIIQGVEVGPSPAWLSDYLTKAGYKSINNVVDVTNFVMHELGQPLHAFDYDKISSKHIVIRAAKNHEKITTLDKVERTLVDGCTLITDQDIPIAIGGVMGGLDTAISDSTHTILLEAAEFKDTRIRKTSKMLGIRTESSARFEHKIDASAVRLALDRASALIQELSGGRILKGVVEQSPYPYRPRFLTLRLSKVNALLGTRFSLSEVESYLKRLSVALSSDDIDTFQLKVPSWRNDIQREVDVIEEVARVFGLNNIEVKRPYHANSEIQHHPLYILEKGVRSRLSSFGLQEFVTCDLISPMECDLEIENGLFKSEYIRVLHAKSIEQSILRPSLLPGLLKALIHNHNQNNFNINAFEVGRVHFKEDKKFTEKSALGIILSGKRAPHHWDTKPSDVDFYDLKGIIENLMQALHLQTAYFEPSSFKTFHPGRQAGIHLPQGTIGVLGEVHPASLRKLDIHERVYFAEIDLHEVERHHTKLVTFTRLPEFPSSELDWTFTMKKKKHLDDLFNALKQIKSPLLKKYALIDIYTHEKIGVDNKNITMRFTYQGDEKTLDLKSVKEEHENITKLLSRYVK